MAYRMSVTCLHAPAALSANGANKTPCVVGPSLYRRLVGQRPAIRPPCTYPWTPGPKQPNRLPSCCCMAARCKVAGEGGLPPPEMAVGCPSSNSMIMLCCTRALLGLRVQSTTEYPALHCAWLALRRSGLMLYHLPWIASNFHIHRVISLSPVSRGLIRLSRHQIRLQKQKKSTLAVTRSSTPRASDSPSSETSPGDQ